MSNQNTYRTLNEAVQGWKQSGLTQIQFCKQNNFPYGRLKNVHRRKSRHFQNQKFR